MNIIYNKENIVFRIKELVLFLHNLNENKVAKYIQNVANINQLLFPIFSHPVKDKSVVVIVYLFPKK